MARSVVAIDTNRKSSGSAYFSALHDRSLPPYMRQRELPSESGYCMADLATADAPRGSTSGSLSTDFCSETGTKKKIPVVKKLNVIYDASWCSMARQGTSNAVEDAAALQPGSKHDPRVRVALQLLESNIARIGLEQAAHAVNLSPSRLRHLIRAELGISPHRYLKERRLLLAKELVQTTFLSVKQIASAAGFADISHFLRDYKVQFGETPSDTRRQGKGYIPC